MPLEPPKAQIAGGKAACVRRRAGDNAFHLRKPTRIEGEWAAPDTMLRSKVDRFVLKMMALWARRKAHEISSYVAGSVGTLAQMKTYRGFPKRLHHRMPHWVEPGALFHIRIRLDREKQQKTLIDPSLAHALLESAKFYEGTMRWHITLFLLMPDHVHAVLSFPRDKSMSEVIRDWKRFHTRTYRVLWQEGYFDHRLRPDERGTQFSAKLNYIRQNPVAAGLCTRAEEWRWLIDPFASKGGSACPQDDATWLAEGADIPRQSRMS